MNRRNSRPPFDACTSTSSYPMPATTGETSSSLPKQKMGRSPSAVKLLKFNRISPFKQPFHEPGCELAPLPGCKIARQLYAAIAQPRQPAHLVADGREQAPHFAVAPLAQHHAVPVVRAFTFLLNFNALEARRGAVEGHALEQPFQLVRLELAADACRVLPLDLEARVHQAV